MGRVTPPIPVVLRPRKLRRVSWVAAPVVVVFFVVLSFALTGSTGEPDNGVFQRSDQCAMVVLGLHRRRRRSCCSTRPKVTADADRIVDRATSSAGTTCPGSSSARSASTGATRGRNLELADDDVVGVMAVQATDKEYAVAGVRALRALLAAHQTGVRRPGGLTPLAG